MGKILDMAEHKFRKLDCQNEVVDLREHFANGPDTPERRASAAAALSRLLREMRNEFGDAYAKKCLVNEMREVK